MATPIRDSPSDHFGVEYTPRSTSSSSECCDTSEDPNDFDYVPQSDDEVTSESDVEDECSEELSEIGEYLPGRAHLPSSNRFRYTPNRLARRACEDMLNLIRAERTRKKRADEVRPLHAIKFSNDFYHHDICFLTCLLDLSRANPIENLVSPVIKIEPSIELIEAEKSYNPVQLTSDMERDTSDDEWIWNENLQLSIIVSIRRIEVDRRPMIRRSSQSPVKSAERILKHVRWDSPIGPGEDCDDSEDDEYFDTITGD